MKKKQKITIGYTTGVFDLFHVGHLRILKKAKEYCDYLIVGVSSDKLVERYKNKTPVISLKERIEIVSSIKYVDEVIVQTDRDKIKAYKKLGFNVMFVGDDWKNTDLFNTVEEELKQHDVKIHYFPYTKHMSSTKLRDLLQEMFDKENHPN